MEQNLMVRPDSRGRLALGKLIDNDRSYTVSVGDHGVVTLVPVGAVLSDEELQDLQTDPEGFAAMLERATQVTSGEASTTSADEFLDQI